MSSNSADVEAGERRNINSELWHACAGPLVSIPPLGSLVVYFPQGHSEQVAASMRKEIDSIPNYPSLPSKLICVLHNVTLHADTETDEVFAQMTLLPVNNYDKEALLASELGLKQNKQPTEFFCKTLTASDTSTHGGFSVPRRAADKIFPPLDFSMQPPAQELVAKDLHDMPWTLKHIYRGQPKRHLLTTGWSVFVSTKRLLAGDSVLFIRDEKSQLLLGIRRAANRQQSALPSSVLSCDSMHIGILAAAAHAAANNSPFTVFYNPRTSPAEFVIPFAKYIKALYTQVSPGMRFRMMFETEECGLRRHVGTVTSVADMDPVRWKNSQWRNLQVNWDESTAGERRTQVSIWEIEPVTTPFYMCPPTFLQPKILRHPVMPDGESNFDNVLKRTMPWLGDDCGIKEEHSSGLSRLSFVQWMAMQQNPQLVASQSAYFPSYVAPAMLDTCADDASRLLNFQSQALTVPNMQQNPKPVPQVSRLDNLQPSTPGVPAQMQHLPQQSPSLQQPPVQYQQLPSTPSKEHQNQNQRLPKDLEKEKTRLLQPGQELQQRPFFSHQSNDQHTKVPQQLLGGKLSSETLLLNQLQQPSLEAQAQAQAQQGMPLPNSQFQQGNYLPNLGAFHQSPLNEPLQQQTSHLKQHQQQLQQSQHCKSQPQMPHLQKLQQQQTIFQFNPQLLPQSQQLPSNQGFSLLKQQQLPTNHVASNIVPEKLVRAHSSLTESEAPSSSSTPSTNFHVSSSSFVNRAHQGSALLDEARGATTVDCLAQMIQNNPDARVKQEFQYSSKESDQSSQQHALADQLDASSSCSFGLDGANEDFPLPPVYFDSGFDQLDPRNCLPLGSNNDCSVSNGLMPRGLGHGKDLENMVSGYGNQRDIGMELSASAVGQSFITRDDSFKASSSNDVAANEGGVFTRGVRPGQSQRMRTYTKVQKRGSVGRSIDVTRYRGYDELRRDLALMFGMAGQLDDPHGSGWKLVYKDHENDVLLVGDDPWEEFVSCVQSIKILSAMEVDPMDAFRW